MTDRSRGGTEGLEPGSLAAFLGFLWRHRWLIVGLTGVCSIATVIYVLVVPVTYTASATLLPQEGSSPGLLSIAASLAGGGLPLAGLAGLKSPEMAIQEAILGSERMADAMDERFGLHDRYGATKREERLRAWYNRLGTGTSKQGLLTVSFKEKDPEFAREVVAALLQELEAINQELRSNESRRQREFVEARLVEAEARLREVEDELVAYQADHQSLALSPTSEAVVIAGAEILARRFRLETEKELLSKSLSADAPAVRAKESEIAALDKELARLPELGSELARLLRERQVRERTYAYLSAQLEDARIEEARNTPTVIVLDPPRVPEEKTWPKRTFTVLGVAFFSGLVSLLLGVLIDAARRVRSHLAASGA